MKQSSVKIASVVWGAGLVMMGFVLSIPPDNLPLYIGLACIVLIPLIFGSRNYRIFGGVALAITLFLAICEYEAGIKQHERMQKMREKFRALQQTNSTPIKQNQR